MPLQGVNIIGYYYDRNSLTQLQSHGATFTDVLHFGYSLSADGTVAEKANFDADLFESEGKALAESYGANTLMLVTAFNRDISDSILSDPNLRALWPCRTLPPLCAKRILTGLTWTLKRLAPLPRFLPRLCTGAEGGTGRGLYRFDFCNLPQQR